MNYNHLRPSDEELDAAIASREHLSLGARRAALIELRFLRHRVNSQRVRIKQLIEEIERLVSQLQAIEGIRPWHTVGRARKIARETLADVKPEHQNSEDE